MLQNKLVVERKKGVIQDTLLLLEHPPTFTIGLRGKEEHFTTPIDTLRNQGITVCRVDRGGDVTFHGPGQLVGYPIMDISARGSDVRQYVDQLEEVIIKTLAGFSLNACRLQGYPGVWVGDRKIASIGIKVNAHGISSHGFALNVHTDLSFFKNIIPCGLSHVCMTSMEKELHEPVSMDQVKNRLIKTFVRVFG